MAPRPNEPLSRVDLNLYTADIERLKSLYGTGWTTKIRELVRIHLTRTVHKQKRLTLGDMIDERE